MCGFVAIVGKSGRAVDRRELARATESIVHRGPDDSGIFVDGSVGLGFRRLSILDLSTQSHQPFEDTNGRFVLVFNGEIYNYVELRKELEQKGYSFRSTGDAEVLLTAYIEWNTACLERFNGMWAFVIYDRKERKIFGSRDRFGIKPLFVCNDGERHIFASEIKAVTATDRVDSRFNSRIAARYLLEGRLSEPDAHDETMFENISEIRAGHAFTVDSNGQFRTWAHWSIPARGLRVSDDPVERFRDLFADSVRLRMRSDVPVGVCLSGGLDSTAVICHMAEQLGNDRSEPLHAFSYQDEQFDEAAQIEATVQQTKAELHSLTSSGASFLDKLDEVMRFHDEPLHSLNVLVSYQLYKLAAASGIKVVLNGQGADETWAGYPSYFRNHWSGLLGAGRVSEAKNEIAAYAAAFGLDGRELLQQSVSTLCRNQLRRAKPYRWLSASRHRRALSDDRWFSTDLLSGQALEIPDFERTDLDTALRDSVLRDPLPLYLRIEDRNSMAHSIETRLPFLDYRLVELAFTTGAEWKIRQQFNKFGLREAMKGVIPEVVRSRVDKMGFPVSAREWFAGPLYSVVRDVVGSSAARQNGILQVDEILRDLERHRRGEVDCSDRLLRVLQFQMLANRVSAPH